MLRPAPAGGRGLLYLGLLLLAGMLAATAAVINELRETALDHARREAGMLAVVVAEHAARSIQAADTLLREIRLRARAGGALPDSRGMQTMLATYARDTPQIDALILVGPDGRVVASSRPQVVPQIAAAVGDTLRHFASHAADTLFVGPPMSSRGGASRSIVLGRRVTGADGALRGVVLGSMPLRYFDTVYQAIGLPRTFGITFLRRDSVSLTPYPRERQQTGVSFVSVQPVRGYPLAVEAGIARDAVLREWWIQASALALGALAAVACALLLGRGLVAQLRRAEAARALEAARAAELEAVRHEMERKSALLRTTLDQMDQGLLMVAADGRVEICNDRARVMLELPAALMDRRPLFTEVLDYQWGQDEFAMTDDRLRRQIRAGGLMSVPQTYERQRPGGTVFEVRSVPLPDGGMVRTFTDITERKRAEERVRYLAHHDDLTRLLNRGRFAEQFEEILATGSEFALFYLDLDHFKDINDTHGHSTGDRLLQAVAARILATVRDGDRVARMGGDEFCILAPGIGEHAAATALAERLLRHIVDPYDLDGVRARVGVSIGIALRGVGATTAEALLRKADEALYSVKQSGRSAWLLAAQAA